MMLSIALLAAAIAVSADTGSAPATPVRDSTGDRTAAIRDTLSGRLPKTISADRSPYLVVSDIVVPQGRSVTIEPGTVLLFRTFTGLKIQGILLARGTVEKPIVFTSVNDKRFNPASTVDAAPYDWNGLYIYDDGMGTNLSQCAVYYSVYGIMSTTKYIHLGPATFRDNGRSNVTIEAREYTVTDAPFEYAVSVDSLKSQQAALTILRDPLAVRRNSARYAGLAVTLAGCFTGIWFSREFGTAYRNFEQVNGTDTDNLVNNSSSVWRNRRDAANADLWLMIGGYAMCVGGAVFFTWSFTF